MGGDATADLTPPSSRMPAVDTMYSVVVAQAVSLYLAYRFAVNIIWFLAGEWLPSGGEVAPPPPPPVAAAAADPALESVERAIMYTSLVVSATLLVFVAGMCAGRRL